MMRERTAGAASSRPCRGEDSLPDHRQPLQFCPASSTFLLLDVLTDHPLRGDREFQQQFHQMAQRLEALRKRAARFSIPAIYVCQSGLRSLPQSLELPLIAASPPGPILAPLHSDYVLRSCQSSVCMLGNLDLLLTPLRVTTLIVGGLAASICPLLAANDVLLASYRLIVPSDCVASPSESDRRNALEHLRHFTDAETPLSDSLVFVESLTPLTPGPNGAGSAMR